MVLIVAVMLVLIGRLGGSHVVFVFFCVVIKVLFEGLFRMSVSAEEFAPGECEGMLSI
jgi:hypothetical protein